MIILFIYLLDNGIIKAIITINKKNYFIFHDHIIKKMLHLNVELVKYFL